MPLTPSMRKPRLTDVSTGTTLTALADPTRRAVFERLAGGPRPVAEVAAGLPVSRPAVSQHLRVLADAGLVTAEKRGRQQLYRVRTEGLAELRAWLDGFWDEALTSYAAAVERAAREEHR
jgi:DNA-binding transcriptional ArsR family regulator